MLTPLDFLTDLTNPQLTFLPKALVVSMLAALVCAVVGTHVVLRGMTFIGDAVAHAVFPGIAVAFVLQGSFLVGGIVAGVITAILIAVFGNHHRLRSDAVIGVFFVAAFALGIVVMSRAPGYGGSLSSFLFGAITGIEDSALVTSAVFTAIVLALLVTPAASARMLTDRIVPMMACAAAIGMGSALLGVYFSWALDLPTGGTIVLVATAIFVLSWALSPRHGVLRNKRRGELDSGAEGTELEAVV